MGFVSEEDDGAEGRPRRMGTISGILGTGVWGLEVFCRPMVAEGGTEDGEGRCSLRRASECVRVA